MSDMSTVRLVSFNWPAVRRRHVGRRFVLCLWCLQVSPVTVDSLPLVHSIPPPAPLDLSKCLIVLINQRVSKYIQRYAKCGRIGDNCAVCLRL